ncbi:MAG: DUF1385 domain-containing protein [Armatimonadetes bacterium]|nr:DUF1385 domain-containing protein [Armatimonadota bacterium]
MDQLRIGSLARPLEPLAPEDTLARATEVIRSVPFDRVPVAVEGRLVGVVTAATLGSAAQTVLQDGISPEEIRLLSIDESVLSTSPALPADASLEEALSLLRHHGGSLPVIRADGLYLGMVDQADVAGALLQKARPPSIGGMATPLGVYLTTGVFSAGARGSLGLALTGAAIGSATVVVSVLMGLLIYGLERTTLFPIRASLNSVPAQWLDLNPYDIWGHILPIIALALFALLFRLLPLTGCHAAEHQVVHAIERDCPLTPESVARMPRVHPRCGTRFFAVGVLLVLFGNGLPISVWWIRYTAAAVAIVLWWRVLGDELQNYVTTKPASPKQIRSAIAAAEELLAKYAHSPGVRASLPTRIWHMGILQVAAGVYFSVTLLTFLAGHYGVPLFMP